MKKIVSCLCVLTFAVIASISGITYAFAATPYEEECDAVFFRTLEDILYDEGKITIKNEITKEPLYDLNLEPLGFVYTMNFEFSEGYALVINTNGIFEVTEIYLDSPNPYKDYLGKKVYATLMLYLVWENDCFIETQSAMVLDEETITAIAEKAFYSSDSILYFSYEAINYTNKVENQYGLAKRHPAYIPVGITNGCTPTAGGNIIGYYTRFYPELIPGFTPGSIMGKYYLYKEAPGEADAVIQTLYRYMGTNLVEPGTTIDGLKSGMIRYCSEKGRSISFNSAMQNNRFNYELAKQRFEDGFPAVVFVDTFSVGKIFNSPNKDAIDYLIGNACHAMAGFGYNEITYTLANGQVRADKYIAVASGLINQSKGYFNINFNTQIDEFYSINIF